ncbi:MAG: hypothetical protein ACXWUN_05265 [Allosphingosinicella sp.]
MRQVIVRFALVALAGFGLHGCSGGGVAERVIKAEPQEIVEAMNRSLRGDGMEVVARADSGDRYRLELDADELREHPSFARLSEQGDLVLNASVNRRKIEFTANFESGLVAGYTIEMERVPEGTHARVTPLIRQPGGGEPNAAAQAALQLGFKRIGEQTLASIADVAES